MARYLNESMNGDAADEDRADRVGGRVVLGLAFGLLLLAGAGGWAGTAQLSGAVIAQGAVKVDRNLRVVQHRDGGIVSEIAAREGDAVQEGQVLIRLDDAQTRAELSIVRMQLAELSIRKARLLAERDGLSDIDLQDTMISDRGHFAQLMAGERRLLQGNLQHRRSLKDQLALSIEQLSEEIRGLTGQRASKVREIELAEAEYHKLKGLADNKLIEGGRVYNAERELTRLQGDRDEIEAGVARAKARISEINLQIIAVDETARTEAQRELSGIEPKLAELRDRGTAIEDRLLRTDIRAPIAGIVNELAVNTLGGVITPAEKLVTIVPAGAELKIAAQLAPVDIDQVRVGQSARLRFTAFNQRTTPELSGVISYISAATAIDETTGQPHYLAEISLAETELSRLGGNRLRPGMPLEVFISTEKRTALSYFTKPLADQFSRALREE